MIVVRHQLVTLKERAKPFSNVGAEEYTFFVDWVKRKFPLICTRQSQREDSDILQLGIPYYEKGKKHRYTYLIQKNDVVKIDELPSLTDVFFGHHSLDFADGVKVYGSYCWEYLTKLTYVHADSDLDILLNYTNQSIQGLTLLMAQLKEQLKGVKIDGEIRFGRLQDCAISELLDIKSKSLLFKSTHDVFLMDRARLYEKYPSLILQ